MLAPPGVRQGIAAQAGSYRTAPGRYNARLRRGARDLASESA